jgi:hypothetical protein
MGRRAALTGAARLGGAGVSVRAAVHPRSALARALSHRAQEGGSTLAMGASRLARCMQPPPSTSPTSSRPCSHQSQHPVKSVLYMSCPGVHMCTHNSSRVSTRSLHLLLPAARRHAAAAVHHGSYYELGERSTQPARVRSQGWRAVRKRTPISSERRHLVRCAAVLRRAAPAWL